MLADRIKLARYAPAAAVPILNTDVVKWPIGSGRPGAMCTSELSDTIVALIGELSAEPDGIDKAAAAFRYPTRIWRMSHHLLRSMKVSGVPRREYQAVMLSLLEIAESLKAGSLFNDDGYNQVLAGPDVSQLLAAAEWTSEARALHRLAGALWTYTEALYFVAHEVGVELHGLYDARGQRVLVRDYFNLAPADLWPAADLLPYGQITITAEYNSSLDLYFDVYNNHYPVSGGFVGAFERGAVLIDGAFVTDPSEIERVAQRVVDKAQSLFADVSAFTEAEQGKKYVEIFWYRLKPMFDALGQDWRPPAAVLRRIDTEGLPPVPPQRVTPPEATYELLNLL